MNVLLVEDNLADAVLLKEQLMHSDAGKFELTHCSNLNEATKNVSSQKFDLVLLDLDLPDSVGVDTVRSMQTVYPDTPIVVLSGNDDDEFAIKALKLGVEDYLIKGAATTERMAELISTAIERHSNSGWNGRLEHLDLPESTLELEQFAMLLLPILKIDSRHGFKTVIIVARVQRHYQGESKTQDINHSVFIVNAIPDAQEIDEAVAEIRNRLSTPIHAGRNRLLARVELGIAVSPDDSYKPKELLAKAIHALTNGTEEHSSGRWHYYSDQLNRRSEHRRRLMRDFRTALDNRQLHLHYQPIVDARSRLTTRMEALLRWVRPDGYVTTAATFIPFVEQNGLSREIDEYVINESGRQLQQWEVDAIPETAIAINISAKYFADTQLTGVISGMLERFEVRPDLFEIEVTESELLANIPLANEIMQEMRALGIKIALDDFGCSFASLDYLRQLPVDRLKIDKSFVRDLDDDRTVTVTEGVIKMAHALGVSVTAEGIEEASQADRLTLMGCDELQGFFFSKPVAATTASQSQAYRMKTVDWEEG